MALPLGELSAKLTERALALPLGELSAKLTERALALPLGEVAEHNEDGEGYMTVKKNNKLLSNARCLRREMTPHERKLWYLFLRHYPVKIYKQRIIESYIVDFYCASAHLVIEIDGTQHYEPAGQNYDTRRSAVLAEAGLRVLRFSNREIDREFPQVCQAIDDAIRGISE